MMSTSGLVPGAASAGRITPMPMEPRRRRWTWSVPATPTTHVCRSRTRSRDRCCPHWTISPPDRRCRSSPNSPSTSRSPSRCGRARPRPQSRRSPHFRWPPPRCGTGWPNTCPRPTLPADSNAAAALDVAKGRADAGVTTALAAERYGLTALATGVVDEAQRAHPVRAGRTAGAAAGPHRRRPHLGGAASRQRPRRAGVGADGVRDPRHRPHAHRIPAHPNGVGHLHLFRSTASDTSTTTRSPRHSKRCTVVVSTCAIWVRGRQDRPRRAPAAARRGVALAEAATGGQAMSGRLVLVRHGQSYGNVDRRLDTRPPGAALTDLGRDQARGFARSCRSRRHDRPFGGAAGRPDRR